MFSDEDYFIDVNFNIYPDELDDRYYDLDDDEDFEPPFDCGYHPDTGICSKAGSEDCDWECPYKNIYFDEK